MQNVCIGLDIERRKYRGGDDEGEDSWPTRCCALLLSTLHSCLLGISCFIFLLLFIFPEIFFFAIHFCTGKVKVRSAYGVPAGQFGRIINNYSTQPNYSELVNFKLVIKKNYHITQP